MFVIYLLITYVIHVNAYEKNEVRNIKDYILDTELHKVPVERQIFNFRKNGIKINVKVIPTIKNDTVQKKDYFPEFPMRDIGKCIIEFSLTCIRKRFVRFLETVSRLDEITLVGQDVKLVKSATVRRSEARSTNNSDVSIQRSVDDFFDSFTLRITLPTWNSKREKNQIDVMFDEAPAVEGRKKSGGCGGGGGGGKGGKCKMMMMGMMMIMKLKIIAIAALKSMMMGGMSLMLSMMMYMKGKGGGGGGPWKGGGGDSYKEIVLLTKSSSGGGGGHSDSYGAPPPSSYGPPSGGGGGYGGGGGGWGRSFHKPMIHDEEIKTEIANGPNHIPMTGEVISKAGSIGFLDYQDYQESPSIIDASSLISNWSTPNYTVFHQDGDSNVSTGLAQNNLRSKAIVNARGRSLIFDEDPINPVNIANLIEKNVASTSTTDRPVDDATHEFTTNTVYTDEWQATIEKTSSSKALPTNSNAGNEFQRTELRAKDIPLLREI